MTSERLRAWRSTLVVVPSTWVAFACGGGSPPATPVAPTPAPATLGVLVVPTLLGVGEMGQARAFTTGNVDVSGQTAWTSSNPAVATVTTTGTVAAIAAGSSTIGGRYQSSTGVYTLQVISGTDIDRIDLGGSVRSVFLGQPFGFSARVIFFGNSLYDLEGDRVAWSTSDPRVVSVARDGTGSSQQAGVADVTATYLGRSGSTRVTVTALDHDLFTYASGGASGVFSPGGRISISADLQFSLLSSPSARIALRTLDQAGNVLGSSPSAVVTQGLFQSISLRDDITIPAGAISICTSAMMTLSSGQVLRADGACFTIRQ